MSIASLVAILAFTLLSCGCTKIKTIVSKPKPECTDLGYQGGMTDGVKQYTVTCVGGKFVYTENKEWEAELVQEDRHKDTIAQSLRTRCLSFSEMQEVNKYGSDLLVHNMVSFNAEEVKLDFANLLAGQAVMCTKPSRRGIK